MKQFCVPEFEIAQFYTIEHDGQLVEVQLISLTSGNARIRIVGSIYCLTVRAVRLRPSGGRAARDAQRLRLEVPGTHQDPTSNPDKQA